MILVEKKRKKGIVKSLNKIYINTLIPDFQFKDKIGKIIKGKNCCINL